MKDPRRMFLVGGVLCFLALISLVFYWMFSGGASASPPGSVTTNRVPSSVGGSIYSWVQELPDGRSVVCVGIQSSGPAISCDWNNAR